MTDREKLIQVFKDIGIKELHECDCFDGHHYWDLGPEIILNTDNDSEKSMEFVFDADGKFSNLV